MKVPFVLILAVLLLAAMSAQAADHVSLGVLPEGVAPPDDDVRSVTCTALMNSSGTYQDGYAWQYDGVQPPDYGAFAECYAFPQDAKICAINLDLTQTGNQTNQTLDLYCWSDDPLNQAPGEVLFTISGIQLGTIATWPNVSRHRISVCCSPCIPAGQRVWVGYWGNWPGAAPGWYVAVDLSPSSQGCPYTKAAPGIGYPPGWQNVNAIWGGAAHALGIGVEYTDCCLLPNCAEAVTLPSGAVAWLNPGGGGDPPMDMPPAVDMVAPQINGVAHTVSGDVSEVQGLVGKAFQFGGATPSGAYVAVPNSPKLNFGVGEFTIEGWFCWHANTHPGRYRIVEKGRYFISGTLEGWALMTTDQPNSLHLHLGNSSIAYWSQFQLPDREWAHLAVTVSRPTASSTRIYFDMHTLSGVHKTKTINLSNMADNVTTSRDLYFGGIPEIPGNEFSGLIDELTLYNRALTPEEIWSIYQAGCNGKQKPAPAAALSVPSVVCAGSPILADASASLSATSYSWCITRVASDCSTPIPPYGQCYAPCYCPTWNFGPMPPGHYLIELFASNDCGTDHAQTCIEVLNDADPMAVLSVPSPICAGEPILADASGSQGADWYSWCWCPVLSDCETPLPPYGECYPPCACPTWDFNQDPGNLPPGNYLIMLGVSNNCGMDFTTQCISITECTSAADGPAVPWKLLLQPSSPNPFRSQTEIRYQLPERTEAELEVFDVAGRVLRRLASGVTSAGDHVTYWDGHDDQGQQVQAGLYFYRLRSGGRDLTRKVIKIQ